MNTIPAALISAALHVAAKNDIRFYLNGVLVEPHADGAIIVATDGYRMLIVRTALEWELGKIIIPRDACELLAKMKGDVEFAAVGDAGRFKAAHGGRTIEFSAIDGRYPDWRATVSRPAEFKAFCSPQTGALVLTVGGAQAAMFGVGGITDRTLKSATFIVMPMRGADYPEALDPDSVRA